MYIATIGILALLGVAALAAILRDAYKKSKRRAVVKRIVDGAQRRREVGWNLKH